MNIIKRLLQGEETNLGRAVYFAHLHCAADRELGKKAAIELEAKNAVIKAAQDLYVRCDKALCTDVYRDYVALEKSLKEMEAALKAGKA